MGVYRFSIAATACLLLTTGALEAQIRLNGRDMNADRLPQGSGPTVSDDQTVAFRRIYCREYSRHQPDADVAYQPSTDPGILPADIEPNLTVDTSSITIPLNIPVSRYLKNPNAYNLPMSDETQVAIGLLTLDERGDLLLNGQPVSMSPEERRYLCGQ